MGDWRLVEGKDVRGDTLEKEKQTLEEYVPDEGRLENPSVVPEYLWRLRLCENWCGCLLTRCIFVGRRDREREREREFTFCGEERERESLDSCGEERERVHIIVGRRGREGYYGLGREVREEAGEEERGPTRRGIV